MKAYNYISVIIGAIVLFSLPSCADDNNLLSEDGNEVSVTFQPWLANDLKTRAIGDAEGIDWLKVAVYEGEETLSKKYIIEQDLEIAKRNGITLTLIEGRSYKILFWAEDKDNSAYVLTDNGKIKVNYDDYKEGGFAKMEEMDAFCTTTIVNVGSTKMENKGSVTLTRPLAQVNFADNTTPPVQGDHQAVVTFRQVPSSFNPFTNKVEETKDNVTFTFTDFTDETLDTEDGSYHYVSSNYLFVSQEEDTSITISAKLDLKDASNGSIIKTVEQSSIPLETNVKTNLNGSIVDTWDVWDETTTPHQPSVDDQGRYVIDEAADLVWLSQNETTLNSGTFIQTINIDMNGKLTSSIKLPAESTYDGGGKTIKNCASSLFGYATNLTIKNLSIENVAASATYHVGVLVNTLRGSSSFENISIKNSSATTTTTNCAAGGVVGYVVRKNEKDRTETLKVSFSNCKLNGVTVSGSASEGKFVGLLSGYDNNESLSFDANCEATDVSVADYKSVYTKANNSAWITGTLDAKYDGWLGHETYRRAKVTFGGVRMVPRWDGTTAIAKADLLLHNGESNKYEVHSPFDLAGVRQTTASPAALYLMENVDMFGQGADGEYNVPSNWTQSANVSEDDKYFMSFSTIPYLDGNDYGIYNLNINTQKVSTSLYYGGFIQSTTGTTTHKNIKFYNSCVVVPLVVYKNEDKGSAGMLVSNIAGDSYTMENVHTDGCKIFALQKVGGLAARVAAATSTIKNCSVNDGYIENYECKEHLEEFGGGLAKFYSYGEVGGIFGFVQDNTTISDCKVTETIIYAFGQSDQLAGVVPGRHVSTLIGDIRTYIGGTIKISNTSVDSNTKCTKRHDKHTYGGFFGIGSKTVKEIGKCYYVATDDTKGKVIFNGTTIFQ